MIHYHGTPITPREELLGMAGRHFCVRYGAHQDLKTCLTIAQSIMFDNGAFSAKTKGVPFDEPGFYGWVEPILFHPHFAVIPDVIDGSAEENDAMVERWPDALWALGAPVWHLAEPLERLLDLVMQGWPRVCFGSSGAFWQIGSPAWSGRMDEAFNALIREYGKTPWIHGLRMLGQAGGDWPLASADSTNVGQNWKRDACCEERKASGLDAVQAPGLWNPRPIQQEMT